MYSEVEPGAMPTMLTSSSAQLFSPSSSRSSSSRGEPAASSLKKAHSRASCSVSYTHLTLPTNREV